MDFILNGEGHGDVATATVKHEGDYGYMRPYLEPNGHAYMNVWNQEKRARFPKNWSIQADLTNSSLLPLDAWKEMDKTMMENAKYPLLFAGDLRSQGLVYSVGAGLAASVLQYQLKSIASKATISMDGIRKGTGDRPAYTTAQQPIPIVHSDFYFTSRQMEHARHGGEPLDFGMLVDATRTVAEEIEKLHLGTSDFDAFTYGGGSLYGLTSFPGRQSYTMTKPSTTGWTGDVMVDELAAMIQLSILAKHTGPWGVYMSPEWSPYMGSDYSAAKGDNTLRERLMKTENIRFMKTAFFLPAWHFVLVQLTRNVVETVIAADFTTVQWSTHGGFQENFKVLASITPRFRTDPNGNAGIVDGLAV